MNNFFETVSSFNDYFVVDINMANLCSRAFSVFQTSQGGVATLNAVKYAVHFKI